MPTVSFVPSTPPGVHRDRGLSETVASAAIKDVVAEIFHLEDCNVRPPGDRFGQMGLDDFADDDVMIALLDDAGDTAFDGSECRIEDRGSGRALVNSLAAQLAAL